jgi:hypothetical protein
LLEGIDDTDQDDYEPLTQIRMGGDKAREKPSDMRNPYRNVLANTSCDEKALDTSTTGLPFDSQDQEEQQPIQTPGPKMSRREWWTKFAMGCVLGLVVGVVLGVRSVSLRDVGQRGCVEAKVGSFSRNWKCRMFEQRGGGF